MRLLITVSSR